jgi:hypothetical protein
MLIAVFWDMLWCVEWPMLVSPTDLCCMLAIWCSKLSCPCIWHEGLQRHGGTVLLIDVSTRQRWAPIFTNGEEPPVPIEQEAGWTTDKAWTLGEEKNLLPLAGIEPLFLGLTANSLVTVLTELLWFFAVPYWKFCMLVMILVWLWQNLLSQTW